MKNGRKTTNNQDFKIFIKYCKKYIKLYSLTDYEIDFKHDTKDGNYEGSIWWDIDSKQATIFLGRSWKPINKKAIEIVAWHEVMHLVLGELDFLAGARYVTKEQLEGSVHSIIHRLQATIFN